MSAAEGIEPSALRLRAKHLAVELSASAPSFNEWHENQKRSSITN